MKYNTSKYFLTILHPTELISPFWARLGYWVTLHPAEQCCILLSFAASYCAKLPPTELLCSLHPLRAMLHLSELLWTLNSFAAPYWAKLHHPELSYTLRPMLYCTLLINAALLPSFWVLLQPSELHWSLLSLQHLGYAAPYWAMLHPTKLSCNLLNFSAPFWVMLHPSELLWTLWDTLHPTEPGWAALHPAKLCLHCTF
jgi:hypothetical protein